MTTMELQQKIEELVNKVRLYNPNADIPLIEKAVRFSYQHLHDKKRLSDEDFFTYSYDVATMLADLKVGSHTLVVGLLHAILEESNIKPEVIEKEFDKEVLTLIEALSRLRNVNKNFNPEAEEERRAENTRKIMLASSKDIRVIIIKIVERLASMRTLKYLPEDMRKIVATETMTIYAPIAHKLGMNSVKGELEDLSFRFLENTRYVELKDKVAKTREQREGEVDKIMELVNDSLIKHDIKAQISGRAKHFYSIYKKIISEDKQFDEIYDLMAIRIIVDSVDDCYKVLGIIHSLWKPMPGRLKDYVAVPKANGYQSLHTGVFVSHGSILEVQIRTNDMHMAAEEGVAAHWRYKGDDKDKKFDRHIALMKQIMDWQRYSANAQEFIENLKIDLFEKEIFVFTPNGDPIALPEEATPVDFAYAVHTDIGNHCKQAKVNGVVVTLDYTLSSGDVVDILTQKNAAPSRSWLSFAKSAHTRTKIRAALNIDVDTKQKKRDPVELLDDDSDFPEEIIVEGKKYDLKIPKCCTPRQSEKTRAFKTKDGKIVVHRVDCPNVYTCDMTKEVKLLLQHVESQIYPLRVDVKDRVGILAELLNYIANEKHNVESVNTRLGKDGRVIITMDIRKSPALDIHKLIQDIKHIDAVINVFIEDERHTNRYTTNTN